MNNVRQDNQHLKKNKLMKEVNKIIKTENIGKSELQMASVGFGLDTYPYCTSG